jgi:hypothetical protein
VIDSQPSASRPRNPRLVSRRLMPRREPMARRELIDRTGWKNVRIEHDDELDNEVTAVTHPLPTLVMQPPPPPRALPMMDSEPGAASFTPVVMHARSTELSVVALVSAVVTFAAVLFAQHAAHWGEARAKISDRAPRQAAAEQSELPMTTHAAVSPSWAATLTSNIPVVRLRDLPLEHGATSRIEYERPTPAPRAERADAERTGGGRSASRAVAAPAPARPAPVAAAPGPADRAELARALSRAAASAQNCGEGPVHAQVVATYAPSGVPSSVHFGSSAPPAAMRSCVLSAVARTRVTPFVGDPVTVSKSLSW